MRPLVLFRHPSSRAYDGEAFTSVEYSRWAGSSKRTYRSQRGVSGTPQVAQTIAPKPTVSGSLGVEAWKPTICSMMSDAW